MLIAHHSARTDDHGALAPVRPKPNTRSVVPEGRYPTKGVAGDCYPADGWKRQVSGHQQFAARRRFPQEAQANPGGLLGVVFKSVLPVGVVEPDRENGVTEERQPL